MKLALFPKAQRMFTLREQMEIAFAAVCAVFGIILLALVALTRIARWLGVQ